VNLCRHIKSREDHILATYIWRTLRRGEFPLVFAELCAGFGVERRELVKLGGQVEEALLRRGDSQAKGNRLGRLAVRVSRSLGAGAQNETSPQRQLVDMLFRWADDRRRFPHGDPRNDYPLVIGCVLAAAELAIATSMACGVSYEAALTQLEADPYHLADMAFVITQGLGLPVSITDVRDTVRYGMTAHGRLRDWLLPEAVEKQRSAAGARLAGFLGVADLRGMSAAELPGRIFDAAVERWRRSALGQTRRKVRIAS
jgi:hypothetical protein